MCSRICAVTLFSAPAPRSHHHPQQNACSPFCVPRALALRVCGVLSKADYACAACVWGVQRLQNAAHTGQDGSAAHTKSPVLRTAHVMGDPWQGNLKERGVRKYLDAVAKAQAGGGVGSGAAGAGGDSAAAPAVQDDAGVQRDEEFEAHMQQLQWQRIGRVTAKLPPAQPDANHDAESGQQQANGAPRRVVGASSKMTDEEEDAYRQQRREAEMKALGLDPAIAALDLPRAAAAKISELEEELERLREEEEEEEEEVWKTASMQARAAVADGAGAWKRGSSKQTAVMDVSSSDEDDDGVVDEILAHEHQAGHAGLGPDEAARLAMELSKLKSQLQDADDDDGPPPAVPEKCSKGSAAACGATVGDDSAPAGVQGVVPANAGAGSKEAKGSQGWGSKFKNFFFGKGSGGSAPHKGTGGGSAAQAEASPAPGKTSDPPAAAIAPTAVIVKPPMATPSVQGSIKLAIKVGGGGGGGRNAAGDGSENAARAAPRMMTALPEDAETLDLHDDYLWMDGDDQLMGADVAAAAAIAAVPGGTAGQERAESADSVMREQEEGAKKQTKQQPAALQIAPAALPSARGTDNMEDAMLEADALLNAFAPPPRPPAAAVQRPPHVPKEALGQRDPAAVSAIADVEALMLQAKDKLRQIEEGDDDARTLAEAQHLKAQVARALAAMDAGGEEARQGVTNVSVPKISQQSRNAVGVPAESVMHNAHDEEATPRMPEHSTPRLGSMEAHVTQQRMAAKAPGAVPPMLSSFLKNMDEAEPLPPPSQRGEYPDDVFAHGEMDASYDDDKTETMSVMSMATAVVDRGELQHRRDARPAPRHQRPVNVSSTITPSVGFSGDSPTAYREGGQQNRWLNSGDTPRSHVAASVADSEQTQVLPTGQAPFAAGAQAHLASGAIAPAAVMPVSPDDASARATGGAEQEAAARGIAVRGASHGDDTHDEQQSQQRQQQTQIQMQRQAQKEQLQHLQAKLQAAAMAPKTAASNASFYTEYSDETSSVRSRDLLQTPKSERHARSHPAPGQRANERDARDLAASSQDPVLAFPHKARKAEGAATWTPGDLHADEDAADETLEDKDKIFDVKKRRKERIAGRVAGRRTLAALPRQRPGTGESGATRSVATEAVNDDIFEESEEEDYEEGHAGIIKRQEEVMAQNMALVMGVGDEGASEWDELDGGGEQDVVAEAPAAKPASIAPVAFGAEDEDSENEEELDPLMAEMKRKARLRAKRARGLEASAVAHAHAEAATQEPAVASSPAPQPEPTELRPRQDARADAEQVARASRHEVPHLKSGKADVVRPPSDMGVGQEPPKAQASHRSMNAEEVTPRLSPRALVKHDDLHPSKRPGQDSAVILAEKDVVVGAKTSLSGASSSDHRKHMDAESESRPFSPDIPPAAKKQARDEGVPLLKMQQRPLSGSTITSRSQSDAGGAAHGELSAQLAPADGNEGGEDRAHIKSARGPEDGTGLASPLGSSDEDGARSDHDKGTGGAPYEANELELSDSELGKAHGSDPRKAESWIQENEEVSALKRRAAKPVSEEAEVRNYSAILTSQLGFLGPLPSVSLPGNDEDSDDSTRSKTRKSKSKDKRSQKTNKHSEARTPSSRGSSLSEDSFDSAISPSASARGDSTRMLRANVRAGEDDAEPNMRVSKWRSHDADEQSDGMSSGSDDGLPKGYGKLAPKDLMRKKRERRKKGADRSLNYASSGEETVSSSLRHVSCSDNESVSAQHRSGRGGNAGGKKAVRYQVRAMPDGTTKRVAVYDDESLLHDETSEQKSDSARGDMQNARRRHVLDDSHVSAQSPGKKGEEEDMRDKAERLQREARMLREAAEHARQQEALRVAAERERLKAQQQVEELKRQLQDAKNGKSAALHAQMMQIRMATEASGEDELNAYLSRPVKAPKVQQPAANLTLVQESVAGSAELKGVVGRVHKVKTAPPAPESSDEGKRATALASTLPPQAAAAACGSVDEMRLMSTASRKAPETAPRLALTSSTASVRSDVRADDKLEEEEEDEELPPELVQRLESVAASLIQQSWRRQRQRTHSHTRDGASQRQSKARSGPEQLAATWAGPSASHSHSTTAASSGPAAVAGGAATASTGLGMGTGRGRSSTAHTMLGASATGADLVPFTLKALQVAVTRSGLATPVDAFVWFDRAGKNGLSHAVLSHGLKTLCATNIDAGQLIFDLNPQAPDGKVTVDEFVSALNWASSGTKDASQLAPGSLSQQISAARGRWKEINARVDHTLHRSVMSKTMPLPGSSLECSLSTTLAATHSLSATHSATLDHAADRSGSTQDGEQQKARVLRDARAAFKSRGFQNVAELFVFVESCGGAKQHGQGGAEVVKAEQLLKALKALHLSRESRTQSLRAHTN